MLLFLFFFSTRYNRNINNIISFCKESTFSLVSTSQSSEKSKHPPTPRRENRTTRPTQYTRRNSPTTCPGTPT